MQYNWSTLMVLRTLLNAWLRHVTWLEMVLHSGLIEVVPVNGLELLSLLIDLEIVRCGSNLWEEEGGAQNPFITDTKGANMICYNLQHCSNLWHGVVDQIRYGLNPDRIWQRVDADQIWVQSALPVWRWCGMLGQICWNRWFIVAYIISQMCHHAWTWYYLDSYLFWLIAQYLFIFMILD